MGRIGISMLGSILLCSCASAPDVEEIHQRYMAASNAHDIEALAEMTAEEIVWKLGPYILRGKREALLPHISDGVMNTTLEVRDRRVLGRVVECEVVEQNDALRAVGVDAWIHYARFVFDGEGRVIRKEPWRSSPDDAEVNRRSLPLRRWIQENHPEAVPDFNDMSDLFGREPALRSKKMRELWVAAGSPGMIRDKGE